MLSNADHGKISSSKKSCEFLGPVEGTIVESSIEHGFGGTATILVKRGTLKKGTFLVCGTTFAKVKLLLDTSAALEIGNVIYKYTNEL